VRSAMGGAVDSGQLERLYALPREEFLKARDALAKELKAAGDRDSAEEVKALRKPSVAAWAVNRLARTRAAEIQHLIEAGQELQRIQRKAASGMTREALRAATSARRRLVDSLVEEAEEILREAGHAASRPTLDHVSQTLEAVALDEQAQDLVRRGILEKELGAPVGFGDLGALSVVVSPGASDEEPPKPAAKGGGRQERASVREAKPSARDREREARRRERAERLRREAEEAEAEAGRLRQAAAEAERAAIKARDATDRAQSRMERARKRAEAAQRELSG
jgi:hypothetical protein